MCWFYTGTLKLLQCVKVSAVNSLHRADKAASKLNRIWKKTERNSCVSVCGQVGIGWLWVVRFSHTHTHWHTFTHTPPLRPRHPGPVVPAAPRRAARLLYWVPGWPVLFSCSNAPFVFVLLFWEWKEGAAHWGEWWIGGRERERERHRERGRYREMEREKSRGSLLLRAHWKPSRGSRLDNLSAAPRLFCEAARLLTAVATAVTSTADKGFRVTLSLLTLLIYPDCLWLLPPCNSTPAATGFQSCCLPFNLFKSSFPIKYPIILIYDQKKDLILKFSSSSLQLHNDKMPWFISLCFYYCCTTPSNGNIANVRHLIYISQNLSLIFWNFGISARISKVVWVFLNQTNPETRQNINWLILFMDIEDQKTQFKGQHIKYKTLISNMMSYKTGQTSTHKHSIPKSISNKTNYILQKNSNRN